MQKFIQLFKKADIVKWIKVNKLRWAGHIIRRPEEARINKIFKSHFVDAKRMRGRPKNSWKEAVDRDSIAFGIGDWQTEPTTESF